jgi:hypothetical protein
VLQALFPRAIEGPEREAIRRALEIEDPAESLETITELARTLLRG